jgi:hypothetical protein
MSTHVASPAGAQYADTFGTNQKNGGDSDRRRTLMVQEFETNLSRQGYECATVVNLNRFPLAVAIADLPTPFAVPAATVAEPVIKHVLNQHFRTMRDLGDARFVPEAVLPVQIAAEFEREYAETGGVFWYRGAGEPSAEMLAEARAKQLAWYKREFGKAVDAWSRYHQHKMITDRQRDAATILHATGEIAQLPEWVTLTRAMSDRSECPMCGESIKRAAKVCKECRSPLHEGWADGKSAPAQNSKPEVQAAKPEVQEAAATTQSSASNQGQGRGPVPGQPLRQQGR